MENRTANNPPEPATRYGIQAGEPLWFARLRVVERHLGAVAALVLFPVDWPLFWLFVVSYFIRIWGMEAVYHRYFSHRAYGAGRIMQFVLALIGAQCGQRGALWWAAKHRTHHKYAETRDDPHSPVAYSFAYAHFKWILEPRNIDTDLDVVPDFARYPELRWLNRFFWLPVYVPAVLLFLAGHLGWFGAGVTGLSALCWGFFLPSALCLHATSLVNSIGHMPNVPGGYQRYSGRDSSVNRPLLALVTLGAGWHNNHHRYAVPARAGFAWYEIDIAYYTLRILEALRLVSNVKSAVPNEILEEGGLRTRTPAGGRHLGSEGAVDETIVGDQVLNKPL